MNEKLLEELQALALYLRESKTYKGCRIGYTATKLELLVRWGL